MKLNKFLPVAITALLVLTTSSALADTTTPTRDERAAQIHSQYDGTFADLKLHV